MRIVPPGPLPRNVAASDLLHRLPEQIDGVLVDLRNAPLRHAEYVRDFLERT